MKRVVKFMCVAVVISMVVGQVAWAGKKKADGEGGAKKPAAELKVLTLTGTLVKQEKKGKGGKELTVLVLTTDDGAKVRIPSPKKGKVKPAEFVGQRVTVTAEGFEKDGKKGKTLVRVKKLKSIKPAA